ncbi:MAG: hypothetical protein KDB82_07250 [Planctomycetes bacterium]|nr:hypothetical protein [Planctomycetota bacterium]
MKRFSLLLVVILLAGCATTPLKPVAPENRNEVVVMGMIHSQHKTSRQYSLKVVEQWIRAINPDYIMVEIPPDRIDTAVEQFKQDGKVTEPRSVVFPEFTDVVLPLQREMHFKLIPVSAWTADLARERTALLNYWQHTRPDDTAEVNAGKNRMFGRMRELTGGDPRKMHTDEFDEIVKEGLEPYIRLFDPDLGDGGFTTITAAHYRLIADALDEHRGEHKRFLVMFGSWHKWFFLERLRKRDDIVVRNPTEFLDD